MRRHRPGSEVQPAAHLGAVVAGGDGNLQRVRRADRGRGGSRPDLRMCQPAGKHRRGGGVGAARDRAAVTRDYYQLTVTSVIRETADACSLVLSVPADLASVFDYRPGQFITVRVPSTQTGSVARCYSMSSMPGVSSLTITVKRTADGYASGYLHERVEAGSVLDVLPPAGPLTPSGPSGLDGGFLMFAAGSGITPVMSILTSVLRTGRGR